MWPVVAAGIAAVVIAIMVLSPAGMARLSALRAEQADLEVELESSRAANIAAEQRVRDLRPELAPVDARAEAEQRQRNVLEKLAREELGYLAPGEVTVTVPATTP
jgi:cell division protein FtsB